MKPNAQLADARPEYIRSLIEDAGITQEEAARAIGISPRRMRAFISTDAQRRAAAPYPVQFALESLAIASTIETLNRFLGERGYGLIGGDEIDCLADVDRSEEAAGMMDHWHQRCDVPQELLDQLARVVRRRSHERDDDGVIPSDQDGDGFTPRD